MVEMSWSYPEIKAALSLIAFKLLLIILCTPFALAYIAYCIICMFTCGFIYAASICCPHSIKIDVERIYDSILELPLALIKSVESWSYLTSRIKKYQAKRDRLRSEPVPLPRTRKRRLSSGEALAQLQSPFLQTLPLEIRQIIYRYVIVSDFEHRHVIEWLEYNNNKRRRTQLLGTGCWNRGRRSPINSCHPDCHAKVKPTSSSTQRKGYVEGALGLAKTCRQIYLESINMYYGS